MTIEEKEWRELCESVADEPDPQRLSELVDQLLKAMDDRRGALRRKEKKVEFGG
jgi:hypothetical protein